MFIKLHYQLGAEDKQGSIKHAHLYAGHLAIAISGHASRHPGWCWHRCPHYSDEEAEHGQVKSLTPWQWK